MFAKFIEKDGRFAFYSKKIHGAAIPDDAVEITEELHAELMDAQSKGKAICRDENGLPVAVDRPAPTEEEIKTAVSMARSSAYAAEADPLFFKAHRGEATMEDWKAKVEEIRARYPDGVLPVQS